MSENIFISIAKLAEALGAQPMNQYPGCWEYQLDEQWRIAVNGHRETMKESTGMPVQPFNCYVEFNGFPAGQFSPYDGFIAAGEAANEETFIAALKLAIEKAKPNKITPDDLHYEPDKHRWKFKR